MGNLLKTAGKVVASKIWVWLLGALGISGSVVIVVIIVFMLLLSAIIGGSTSNQESDYSGGGMYSCSSTGDINQEKWDAVFNDSNRSGKLNGYGDKIIQLSQEKGIDPVLFASISLHETAWGKSNAIQSKNNPGGLMTSSGLMSFATLDEGLESMARTLYNRIIVDGLLTIEKLGSVYAPIGADNDPTGLNNHWVPTVENIAVNHLGGLTMNCDSMKDFEFIFDGDVSALRESLATTGTKWLGRPYVWGGGRTPEGASRGEFDCSSFVHWVYKQNGMELGNMGSVSTETLKHLGTKISINEIKVGDLIFWDTYKPDGHVAIYIGDGKFIGAQSSNGVSIEKLSNTYWQSVFSGHVRRIVQD